MRRLARLGTASASRMALALACGALGGLCALCALGALGALEKDARADWPVSRRDPARTATAPGKSSITVPVRYWQYYVGGTLSGASHVALDVNKDGVTDVVYLAGGKAIAKLADDRLVWESTPVELQSLHGVVDLDGDGVLDIVASSNRNVFVLDGATGKVVWKEPDGEVGAVGGVRLADLDGDGRSEILIDECGCCGISATASPPGGVYHFDGGKLASPTKLYAPLTRGHCGSSSLAVGDFDGDGVSDVAYADAGTVILTSGKTGATLGTSAALGETIYYSSCQATNLDGVVGDELVCFQDSYLATAGGGRRVWVLGYDKTKSPAVQTLWNAAPVDKASGRLSWVGNSVVDLDGDGKFEIVASWFDGTAWSTKVHDALSGAVLASVAGEKLLGVVDVDGDKKPELGVAMATFYAVLKPNFVTKTIDLLWKTPNHDLSSSVTGSSVFDFEGDGKAEVIYNDECFLWVFDGATGAVRFAAPTTSFTGTEASVVADVDGDGRAEILMISNGADPSSAGWGCMDASGNAVTVNGVKWTPSSLPNKSYRGITAFGDAANAWVGTRTLWSEHTYHVSNICDDRDSACLAPNTYGAIPKVEQTAWSLPWLNDFRQNVQDKGIFDAPNATVSLDVQCGVPTHLIVSLRNVGLASLPAGVDVNVYAWSGATKTQIGKVTSTQVLLPGQTEPMPFTVDPTMGTQDTTYSAGVLVDPASPKFQQCRTDDDDSGQVRAKCTQ